MSLSLRSRFWWVSLGLVMTTWLLLAFVVTTMVTPDVAQRIVRMEETNRLLLLSRELTKVPQRDWESLLEREEYIDLASTPLEAEELSVEIPDSGFRLVSSRPQTFWESRRVLQPLPGRSLLALLAFGLGLFALSHLLSRFVIEPVSKLTDGVKALSEGERGVEVPVPSEIELAELARGFNRMSSELAQREAELHRALEAKEKIFATTNHELRTPLTVVLGYCQMLQDGMKGQLTEEQLRIVGVVKRNAESLLEQVETLLTLSQLRSQSLPLKLETADLRDLAHEVTEELQGLVSQRGLKLTIEVPEQAVMAEVDYRRGCQILRNLLANAVKFTDSGSLKVRVNSGDGRGEVLVQDSGLGISEDFQALLFQEFARGENAEGVEGSGLGLALSRRLARGMGGDLILLSSGREGSVFQWSVGLEKH